MGGVGDSFYTPTQVYYDDGSVLINFDNSSRWKVPYDLGVCILR